MNAFALYRLPKDRVCHFICGESSSLSHLKNISKKKGYLFAPFHSDTQYPNIFISAEKHLHGTIKQLCQDNVLPYFPPEKPKQIVSTSRKDYHNAFEQCRKALEEKEYQKLVLSRIEIIHNTNPFNALQLFENACLLYPTQYVALIGSPQSGMWLTATPEVLLEEDLPERWHTMALAGTKWDKESQWDAKNIAEHKVVSRFITNTLKPYVNNMEHKAMQTVEAGKVSHLRTDFFFQVQRKDLYQSICALHPTPATCGMPQKKAKEFLRCTEQHKRAYYSGFSGPWNMPHMSTHLFVTLRCMEIYRHDAVLYAGGGLLSMSEEETEWNETKMKIETIKRCTATTHI